LLNLDLGEMIVSVSVVPLKPLVSPFSLYTISVGFVDLTLMLGFRSLCASFSCTEVCSFKFRENSRRLKVAEF